MSRISTITAIVCLSTVIVCRAEMQTFPNGFHNGGTGSCDGCHSRNNKLPAAFANNSSAAGPTQVEEREERRGMLTGEDPSSTCLLCHTAPKGSQQPFGYFVATDNGDLQGGQPPMQLTPGGDFGWLKKNYAWSGKNGTSPGERHGHNVVAKKFNYAVDRTNVQAPNGMYPADRLSCISCHDPHGNYRRYRDGTMQASGMSIKASGSYDNSPEPDADGAVGSYRMLAGKGYQPKGLMGSYAFQNDPPDAVAPAQYDRAEAASDTRVAYGSNMSEWCQNCHAPHNHPSGNSSRITAEVANNYNSYLGSGNMAGSKSRSYSSLVPFEKGTRDYATLKGIANSDGSERSGPTAGEHVMCLSCHRAHASAWDFMLRWNVKSKMIVYEGKFPGVDNQAPAEYSQGRTSLETKKAYYDRPTSSFSDFQRGLCSKCHAKD